MWGLLWLWGALLTSAGRDLTFYLCFYLFVCLFVYLGDIHAALPVWITDNIWSFWIALKMYKSCILPVEPREQEQGWISIPDERSDCLLVDFLPFLSNEKTNTEIIRALTLTVGLENENRSFVLPLSLFRKQPVLRMWNDNVSFSSNMQSEAGKQEQRNSCAVI